MLKFMSTSEQLKLLEEQIAQFEKETELEVELISVPEADFAAKVASMIEEGNLPDVITLPRPGIAQLQANGLLQALDDLIEGSLRQDFLPDALANNIFDDQLFALPWRRGQACSPYFSSLALSAKSNQPDEALKLINFLTQPEQQLQNYEQTGELYFPTRQSVYEILGFKCPPSGKLVGLSPENKQRVIKIVEERAPALQSILKRNSAALQEMGLLEEPQSFNPLLSTAAVQYRDQKDEEKRHEEEGSRTDVLMLPDMALKILAHGQQVTVRDAATDEELFDLTPLLTYLSSSHQLLQQERQARLQAEAKIEQVAQRERQVALQPRVKLEELLPPKQLLPTAAVDNQEDEQASTMLTVAAPVTINFSSENFKKALLSESGVIVGAFFGVDEPLELRLSSGDTFTILPGEDMAIKWRADEGNMNEVGYYLIKADGNEERIGTTVLREIQGNVEQPFVTIEIGSCTICYYIDGQRSCTTIYNATVASYYAWSLETFTDAIIQSFSCD